jgi:hypothetical protein
VNGVGRADARHSVARLFRNAREAHGERFRDRLRLSQDKPHVDSAQKFGDLAAVPNGACSRTGDL